MKGEAYASPNLENDEMDDKLINTYVNALASQLNEKNLENILLKSKLTIAEEQLRQFRDKVETQQSEFVESDVEYNKAKKK